MAFVSNQQLKDSIYTLGRVLESRDEGSFWQQNHWSNAMEKYLPSPQEIVRQLNHIRVEDVELRSRNVQKMQDAYDSYEGEGEMCEETGKVWEEGEYEDMEDEIENEKEDIMFDRALYYHLHKLARVLKLEVREPCVGDHSYWWSLAETW